MYAGSKCGGSGARHLEKYTETSSYQPHNPNPLTSTRHKTSNNYEKPQKILKMPKQKKQPQSTPQSQSKPPNWPPLRPLLPPTDLSFTPLLQDQIYLIHNFLPATLCKTYTSFLSSLPLATTPGKPKKDEAVRVNDRFQVEDGRFAEMLWSGTALRELVTTGLCRGGYDEDEDEDGNGNGNVDGLKEEGDVALEELARRTWGGKVLGLNPNIRIYRYSTGQFFAQHCMSSPLFQPSDREVRY